MRIFKLSLGIAALGVALVGCSSSPNEYSPAEEPTNLAAYAASNHYPLSTTAKDNRHITAVVDRKTGQITLRNFDSGPIANFKLWINQTYVIHVDRIEPNSFRIIEPADVFNSAGNSLNRVPADSIQKVQIEMPSGELWNAQGPQMQ
jgi:hypothetical protein